MAGRRTAYYHYEDFARRDIVLSKRAKYESLTFEEQQLLPWFHDYLANLEMCVRMNGEFMRQVATTVAPSWGIVSSPDTWGSAQYQDYDKVRYVMKQIVREWASEGCEERCTGLERIMGVLGREFPDFEQRSKARVLVPGAGLGRLNHELVKMGFWCQGNEFSYHMLLASNYILNCTRMANEHSIFPFIHSTSNQYSRSLQTRPIFFPDAHPLTELQMIQKDHPTTDFADLMSIASGSFADLYGPEDLSESQTYSKEKFAMEFRQENANSFDCVVTHFFIDTSSNVIEYLKTLNHCLKPGALWINYGPLLWHYEDDGAVYEIKHPDQTVHNAPVRGLELSAEDLLSLSSNWFELIHRESGIESGYSSDVRAMGGYKYRCEFWVLKKKLQS